jgi:L-threonylcarbamoyladenylate synthase
MKYINIQQASEILSSYNHADALVAIPTETVYGLAANVEHSKAIDNIFRLKTRPANHPLIVHVASHFDIERYVKLNHTAIRIIDKVWPAPLTIVLPKTKYINENITGGQNTVAIRSPNHALAQSLLASINSGLAAPSANKFGRISPTSASHVRQEFMHDNINILDGGDCDIGLESTIININEDNTISILRHGMFDLNILQELADIKLKAQNHNKNKVRVSGDMLSHYAPVAKLHVMDIEHIVHTASVNDVILANKYSFSLAIDSGIKSKLHINMPEHDKPLEYAKFLYSALRQADNICTSMNVNGCIYIEKPACETDLWLAINDRLAKASYIK